MGNNMFITLKPFELLNVYGAKYGTGKMFDAQNQYQNRN